MKIIFLIVMLTYVPSVIAMMEHKPGQGNEPTTERLRLSRGCFKEIASYGCGHPSEDHEFFKSCLHEKMDVLTNPCQEFFERLYGKKKN